MVKPITPTEAKKSQIVALPDGVIEAVNEAITANMRGDMAIVMQDDLALRIASKMACPREKVFANGWLDFENAYRKAGWHVEYDKPGYNESYEASFTFRKKK